MLRGAPHEVAAVADGLEIKRRYKSGVIAYAPEDGPTAASWSTAGCKNIAPPGWQQTFDPLRDALNWEHGWARPDDLERGRPAGQPAHEAKCEAAELRATGEYLSARIAAGQVSNRTDVVAAL